MTMGITIHYRFARTESPEGLLDEAEQLARQLGMTIVERKAHALVIHPHPESEYISLRWKQVKNIALPGEGYDYARATMSDLGELDKQMWFCSDFTKTQFAGAAAHAQVCELIRFVACHCYKSCVHDEADYYEAGSGSDRAERLKQAFDASNKALAKIAAMLTDKFGAEKVLVGARLGG